MRRRRWRSRTVDTFLKPAATGLKALGKAFFTIRKSRSSTSAARARRGRRPECETKAKGGSVPSREHDGLNREQERVRPHLELTRVQRRRWLDDRLRDEGHPIELELRVDTPNLVRARHVAVCIEVLRSGGSLPVDVLPGGDGG